MTPLRFFEIIPGALAWLTIIGMFVFSWLLPKEVAIFVILFDMYWLLKSIYLSLHLRHTFVKMRENMRIDWLKKLESEKPEFSDLYHLVIFPMYKEPYEVVRESFARIRDINYPREKIIAVLAIEEKAGKEAESTAYKIEEEFKNSFFKFLVTKHPANLPNELQGKGSNETWAAKKTKEWIIDPEQIPYEKILVSVFDIDTQVPKDYFGILAHTFLTSEHPQRSSFQPVPLFTNNIFQAPALARTISFSATFWQMMQQSRPERLTTFSSHSMPFKALVEIGFWQKDIVSEDSRIFWQCFLHYNGDWRVVPLFYPVSMDANVAPTFWGTMINLYKQQRRWGWGVENVPYLLQGFRKNKKIPRRTKWYWTINSIEGFHSWSTNSLMIFALGWLPLLIGGEIFNATVLSYNLPYVTRLILSVSMVGIASSAILSIVLLPPKPTWFRWWHYPLYVLQWLLIPITLIIFGAFPGLEAQTRLMLGKKYHLGFWVTPKTRKGVGETR